MIISPEITVALLAATPLIEIPGAVPAGLLMNIPIPELMFWAMLGNTLVTIPLLILIKEIIKFCFKYIPFLHKKIEIKLQKFNTKHRQGIEKWGPAFIAFFVLIPLPASGSYSGVLLADLFEIKFWPALISIIIGNFLRVLLIAGGFELFVKLFGVA